MMACVIMPVPASTPAMVDILPEVPVIDITVTVGVALNGTGILLSIGVQYCVLNPMQNNVARFVLVLGTVSISYDF